MLELRNASLGYGSQPVLDKLDLHIGAGERIGIVGASGAGKSTLLKLGAGLLAPSEGQYRNSFRRVRMVFQEPRLLPWRSIARNIEIPLQAAGLPANEIRGRCDYWLEAVGLADVADAWPSELSGGMAQRVSIARAFAVQPDLVLLDEPFSALDPALRVSLGCLCVEHARATGATLLCVSHHPHELVDMVDRCLLIADRCVCNYDIGSDPAARTAIADCLHQRLLGPCSATPTPTPTRETTCKPYLS